MENDRYLNLAPSPLSLIESLRDIGYSMETAVADIIDNSITAKASNVWIRFSWNSDNPWIAIIDDGYGMTEDELIEAMRLGSKNPREDRTEDDLGRFGLGMKTASFSQCRHLTVLSKKNRLLSCCDWNLDKIALDYHKNKTNEWRLGITNPDDIPKHETLHALHQEYLEQIDTGTIVMWERIDRIESQNTSMAREKLFNSLLDDARNHLELVFHRFLSPDPGKKRVAIVMNGDELEAFNPFNPKRLATQDLDEQRFSLDGEEILIQPYILPHLNKVPRQEYEKYAGEGGYLQNQGFYIYRNRRLIIKGTWFRLIKKSYLNQLIRIRVDIPNTLDHLWKIDVKKSNATLPESVRKELHQIIGKIEIKGKKVFEQKGQNLPSKVKIPVWNRRAARGSIIYEINREYPLIEQLFESISFEQKVLLKDLIAVFESNFPADMFFNDFASNPEKIERPEFDENSLERLLETFVLFWAHEGIEEKDIANVLLSTEPFASNREFCKTVLEQKGYLP